MFGQVNFDVAAIEIMKSRVHLLSLAAVQSA